MLKIREENAQSINENKKFEVINEFLSKYGNRDLLFKLFRTEQKGYLYDPGTNKIISCNNIEFDLIRLLSKNNRDILCKEIMKNFNENILMKALCSLENAINKENVLKTEAAEGFGLSSHYLNYAELAKSHLWIMTLEITEKCNLRCEYCVYDSRFLQKRNHGINNMSFPIAKASIDYLKAHSYNRNDVAIVFYGGEPLLRFSFIQSCVEYAKKVFDKKTIRFSITTNLTKINNSIAEYFYKNNFSILVSIDGPGEIHDDYRKYPNGKGSFNKAIDGLKILRNVFDEEFVNRVMISIVYAPPNSKQKIEKIATLWKEYSWLPKEISVQITYPEAGSVHDRIIDRVEDVNLQEWAIEKYWEYVIEKKEISAIAKSIVEKNLAYILKRTIYDKPNNKYHLNGCCIPGERRLYVSTKGMFRVCERVATAAPEIGNVYTGIDLKTIKSFYIDAYDKESLPDCRLCWAIRMCRLCYMYAINGSEIDICKKRQSCKSMKYSLEGYMKLFCMVLERNDTSLNYLNQYEIS